MLQAALLLLACLLVGEGVTALLHVPIPGAVAGMGLLLLFLLLRGQVSVELHKLAGGLLAYLPLLFVPAAVGMMEHGDLLRSQGVRLLLVLVISTVIALGFTGMCLQWLLNRQASKRV